MAVETTIVLRACIVMGMLLALVVVASYYYNNNKHKDTFVDEAQPEDGVQYPQARDPGAGQEYRGVDYDVQTPPVSNGGCFPKDALTAEQLLPKDAVNTAWAQDAPAGQGDINGINFLNAGYTIGLLNQVNRNPNYQLRSEPPNPQVVVSPWGNSTIDPDLTRRPLELEAAPTCADPSA